MNGIPYVSGTAIATDNVYTFFVSDLAGNTTGGTFILDKTPPSVANITS